MNWNAKSLAICVLTLTATFSIASTTRAQNSVAVTQPPSSVIVLDSTKAQDGLNGSVRRVKTEFAKLELKNGQIVEGPRQLIELTTYDISGKRSENISYPVTSSLVGKEEYKYDDHGNIIEMTTRSDDGALLSKEAYDYEFDSFGNWTKMVTSLVVFESDELKREPVEVTYRSLTYYFDDSVAKIATTPSPERLAAGLPASSQILLQGPGSESPQSTSGGMPSVPESIEETHDGVNALTKETASPLSASTNSGSAGRAERSPDVVASTTATADKHAFELYKTGRDLFDSGDVKGAIVAYRQSLELAPRSADVELSLGLAYLNLKKHKEAAKAFKESLRLNADLTEAHYGLGLASFRMGRYKDAADAFKKAVQISPDLGKAHYGLALAYQELEDVAGVIEQYRILQGLDGDLAKQLARAFPVFDLPCHAGAACK